MKPYIITIIYVCLFLVIFSLFGFYWAIRPIRITSSITPKDYGVDYENIAFRTSDNKLIKGWFIPSKNPHAKTIILLHGYPADKGNILPSRLFLHHSYNLLFLDFRYFGESEGYYSTAGKNEILDVLAAIKYLHSRGINSVGIWGFSVGGAVALMTAEKAPEVKAVVAESSYARMDWMAYEYYRIPLLRYPLGMLTRFWAWLFLHEDILSVSPANSAAKLKIPVLLIHSESDNVIPFKHALLLKEAFKDNKTALAIFNQGLSHGESFANYEITVKSFFDKNL